MSSSILIVWQVSKSFGSKKILKDISIDLHQGEILGLIGSSGSGKTTLLKTIIGFHKPDVGDVKFKVSSLFSKSKSTGDFVSLYDQHEFAINVFGFASQEPSFYENLTVKENLEYFGSLYGLATKDLDSNIDILISLMDLKHAQHTFAGKLSGGMQRRLDIACAMVHDPDVLILDEPTADLDPVLRMHMWNVIRKINKKGTTILIASHHLAEVEEFCSRIAILKEGNLIDLNTPSRIKANHSETEKITIQSYPENYAQILYSLKESFGFE